MRIVPSPYAEGLSRTPVARHHVDVDGLPAAWWEYGEPGPGPTLLLVHGFRGDHHGLEPVVSFLPGVHVVAPDLPGFGASAPLPGEHSVDGYSAWLRAFAATIGLPADAVVVGHSFGTIVAAKALADGLPAARAVLLNPIAAPALAGPNALGTRLSSLYFGVGAALPERIGNALLQSRVITRGAGAFLAKTKDPALRRWIHDQHDRYFSGYATRRVVLEAFRASVDHDITEWADRLTLPVHLVAAEHDDITTVEAVRRLRAMLPDATMAVIPDVGHLVHYETPRDAAREIAAVAGLQVA
ncbi:alpha/beta fold hydrolase [Amnibacterium setariae]|uniref:Alpha/beta hydrolase n=1 Tax=Amnibacterium setariae TaxID=2306585 RepID=A0A3A1TVX9_9MICO|nr:alpha/beta hydrolase [Amnibacterium setariae]RIX27949.1 alpha/beta hydrolase [Amnibacterium setariae]